MVTFHGFTDRIRLVTRQVMTPLSAAALDFVYPPECLLCGQELETGSCLFCEPCVTKIKPRLLTECSRCGAPVGPYANLEKGCGQCRRESFAFDRVIRLGIYDGEMRLACLRAKAAGGSAVARGLARTLVDEKRAQFDEQKIDLAMPVPEHWTRRLIHASYAAETMAREVSRQLKVQWSRTILFKRRRTPKQATSPTALRRQQQQGSFGIRRAKELAGKTILLIDDILTTGSTANAAARELKRAGARTVIVAVIAVSPLRK